MAEIIPKLTNRPQVGDEVRRFLQALQGAGFRGDVHADYATRLANATDNSVYQIIPQAVVAPKDASDVVLLGRVLRLEEHRRVTVSPRGGGTGTNGQSLSAGLIVDMSRHLNQIVEFNREESWVRVQPGVVLDQLNDYLRSSGVFFAPSVSPSSRATLGGMIATDACGMGSRVYGKTSGHVLEASLVFVDGSTWVSKDITEAELELDKGRADRVGEVLRVVDHVVTMKEALIERQFPKIPRYLTGYNLAHVRRPGQRFSINPIISGAEGTLAFITEAKLRVLPLPQHSVLVVVCYASFDDALRAAESLVKADPSAIETIDDVILSLARADVVWDRVAHLFRDDVFQSAAALNFVELSGGDVDDVQQRLDTLVRSLEVKRGNADEAIGQFVARLPADIAALWELRKKGVGLLSTLPGERRPVAFVEDTAVHPRVLPAYIREFRAILEQAGLRYGMFGHADAGCVHVRPALNLRDPRDAALLRTISDQVVALVRKFGGVMWSEHGKGFRSEYSPQFFGEELFEDLCRIKRAFDPHNQMNPGKLAVPAESNAKLTTVDAPKRGEFDRAIAEASLARYSTAVICDGNAACFNYDADSVMCPSSKATRDRVHSPKGRAAMLREWLRQLAEAGYDAASQRSGERGVVRPRVRSNRVDGDAVSEGDSYDFSHEVYAAMDGCLGCKACATQCPLKVDVPELKAEFLNLYHRRYRRPLKDLVAAGFETTAARLAHFPRTFNAILGWRWVAESVRRVVGIVDLPRFAAKSLTAGLRERKAPLFDLARLASLSVQERARSVVLIQDVFHAFYDTHVTLAAYDLMKNLGLDVYVAPYFPSGKALHVKGFLDRFEIVARRNVGFFRQVAACDIAMVCLDPAVTLTFRQEYARLLQEPLRYRVHLVQEWLGQQDERLTDASQRKMWQRDRTSRSRTAASFVLLGHCTEATSVPAAQREWSKLFGLFGERLEIESVGCCGMAGIYGHEVNHYRESRDIYSMSWERKLSPEWDESRRYLATGYSCRSQAKRFSASHRALEHPIEALRELAQ